MKLSSFHRCLNRLLLGAMLFVGCAEDAATGQIGSSCIDGSDCVDSLICSEEGTCFDPCEDMLCDTPDPGECTEDGRGYTRFHTPGTCLINEEKTEAYCVYLELENDPVRCNQPPEDECIATLMVFYELQGRCVLDENAYPTCDYFQEAVDCQDFRGSHPESCSQDGTQLFVRELTGQCIISDNGFSVGPRCESTIETVQCDENIWRRCIDGNETQYEAATNGSCQDFLEPETNEPSYECRYDWELRDCPAGQRCQFGRCIN